MRITVALTAIAALLGLAGCQTMPYQPYARAVKTKPQAGGVIALNLEHRDEDRQKAQTMMSMNCGTKPVKVLEEGEVVIGTETSTQGTQNNYKNDRSSGKLFGIPFTTADSTNSTNSTSSTTQKKEWQISYECEVASAGTGKKSKVQ